MIKVLFVCVMVAIIQIFSLSAMETMNVKMEAGYILNVQMI